MSAPIKNTPVSIERPLTVYVEAFAVNESGPDPRWAKVHLDQVLLERILRLRELVRQEQLVAVSDGKAPVWSWDCKGTSGQTGRFRVQRLEVREEGFYFSAVLGDADYEIDTRPLNFGALFKAIAGSDEGPICQRVGDVIIYASSDARAEFVERLREAGENFGAFEDPDSGPGPAI